MWSLLELCTVFLAAVVLGTRPPRLPSAHQLAKKDRYALEEGLSFLFLPVAPLRLNNSSHLCTSKALPPLKDIKYRCNCTAYRPEKSRNPNKNMPICMVITQKCKIQCLLFRSLEIQSTDKYFVAFMSDIKIMCILPRRHSEVNASRIM